MFPYTHMYMHVSNDPKIRNNTVCRAVIQPSNLSYTCFITKPHYCEKRFILKGAVHVHLHCTLCKEFSLVVSTENIIWNFPIKNQQ